MKALIIIVAVIVGFTPLALAIYYYTKNKANINWFYYENKKKHKAHIKENETALHGQIVMIGDSIIDLYKTDKIYGNSPIKVYNRGISGDTSENMRARFVESALTIEPSKLFMLIGTNDVHKGIDDDTTISNIRAMIEDAKAHNVAHIYVESVYPVNIKVDKDMVANRTNEHINNLNDRIAMLCEELGVTYINIHDSLTDEDGAFRAEYTIDGLHPNDTGYGVVTNILSEYI